MIILFNCDCVLHTKAVDNREEYYWVLCRVHEADPSAPRLFRGYSTKGAVKVLEPDSETSSDFKEINSQFPVL